MESAVGLGFRAETFESFDPEMFPSFPLRGRLTGQRPGCDLAVITHKTPLPSIVIQHSL